jgi:hypothetical protein
MQLRNVRFVVRNAPVIPTVFNWKVSKSVVACQPAYDRCDMSPWLPTLVILAMS